MENRYGGNASYPTAGAGYAQTPAPPIETDQSTLTGCLGALRAQIDRLEERMHVTSEFTNFIVGQETKEAGGKTSLQPVYSGLIAEISEQITRMDRLINGMCYDHGRLERAIRG